MTSDAVLIVRWIFGYCWTLFTSWRIPGTDVTPAAMGFFLILSSFALRYLSSVLKKEDTSGKDD